MRRRIEPQTLADHSNLPEILEVLSRLADLGAGELSALADGWQDAASLAGARDAALRPDSPLVLEVLAVFDALTVLYAEELDGGPHAVVPAAVASRALKAVRDAVAAAYARPSLSRGGYQGLLGPWRAVFPASGDVCEPDLGPQAVPVKQLLAGFAALSVRCHDETAAAAWEQLEVAVLSQDEDALRDAVARAQQAARQAGRHRLWDLVRRCAAEGLSRGCPRCGRTAAAVDRRVVTLGAHAACALLVRDVLDSATVDTLVKPVTELVPLPRQGD